MSYREDGLHEALAIEWRGEFDNDSVNVLHAEAFGHPILPEDWHAQIHYHSLGWVTARASTGELIGFVNVAWDGGVHAFVLDTMVTQGARRAGIATRLVRLAIQQSRAAGCEWLHVDFEPELSPFYLDACGFVPTPGGVLRLR